MSDGKNGQLIQFPRYVRMRQVGFSTPTDEGMKQMRATEVIDYYEGTTVCFIGAESVSVRVPGIPQPTQMTVEFVIPATTIGDAFGPLYAEARDNAVAQVKDHIAKQSLLIAGKGGLQTPPPFPHDRGRIRGI